MDVTPHDPFETTIPYSHFGNKDPQFKSRYSSHPPGTAQPPQSDYKYIIILGVVGIGAYLYFKR